MTGGSCSFNDCSISLVATSSFSLPVFGKLFTNAQTPIIHSTVGITFILMVLCRIHSCAILSILYPPKIREIIYCIPVYGGEILHSCLWRGDLRGWFGKFFMVIGSKWCMPELQLAAINGIGVNVLFTFCWLLLNALQFSSWWRFCTPCTSRRGSVYSN